MNHLPLAGITVVALELAVAAPFATRQLADLGARVIKVERPGGDFARGYDRTVHGQSSYFVWLNRGKESVVLDVKDPADRAVLGAMIDRADGTPEAPSRAGFSVADLATGGYAYSGILAALYDRERTGAGASLRVSLLALRPVRRGSPARGCAPRPTSPGTRSCSPGTAGAPSARPAARSTRCCRRSRCPALSRSWARFLRWGSIPRPSARSSARAGEGGRRLPGAETRPATAGPRTRCPRGASRSGRSAACRRCPRPAGPGRG